MYRLFIDESGKNTFRDFVNSPPHFSIGGVMVHKNADDFIKRRGDQIKFKYWGHTNITFHGYEIRHLKGDFSIFRDSVDPVTNIVQDNSKKRKEFLEDFLDYIKKSNFRFILVCVNKKEWIKNRPEIAHAIQEGWSEMITGSEKKLTREVFEEIAKTYICYLARKKRDGQIIIEASDIRQDGDMLAIYNQFMSKGIPIMGMSNIDVRDKLTCISFVTKNNRDHETQLADIGTYFLSIKARDDDGITFGSKMTDFDKELVAVFNSKSFIDECTADRSVSIKRLI